MQPHTHQVLFKRIEMFYDPHDHQTSAKAHLTEAFIFLEDKNVRTSPNMLTRKRKELTENDKLFSNSSETSHALSHRNGLRQSTVVRLSSCNTEKLHRLVSMLPSIDANVESQEVGDDVPTRQPRMKFVFGYEEDKIVQLYATGISAAIVARTVNRPDRTVTDVLRRKGVKIRQHPVTTRAYVDEVARLYESGLSLAKVGNVLGVSRNTVEKHLVRVGTNLRDKSEAAQNKPNRKVH